VSTAIRLRPRNALDRVQRRRAAGVGRGVLLDLHLVAGVVRARLLDHGTEGVTMPRGTVVVEVWGGKPKAVLEHVAHANRSMRGLVVVTIHRRARRWDRFVAWWRWAWAEVFRR
jgi:hypothetical protein